MSSPRDLIIKTLITAWLDASQKSSVKLKSLYTLLFEKHPAKLQLQF